MNNKFGMNFHHLGLALRDDEQAIQFLQCVGYVIGKKVYDPEQNVHLRLCVAGEQPSIELILPGHGSSPLEPILKRYSEVFYHTCYEVNSVSETLNDMENKGLRIIPISPAKPAILFENRNVSFYKIMGFGLIELLESE